MIPPKQGLRILVVDDDVGMVATLSDILGVAGYRVDIAHTGREAIDRVRRHAPDCVLMDVRMPGLTGVDAFREIKRLAPESSVIFMTAYAASSLVAEARREGAVEVLTKPLDLERVLNLLEEAARNTPVLVVDDDTSFCHSLAEGLRAHDFDVHAVSDVDEAIQRFEQEPRRVVILDMQLDHRSGLDVLKTMKEINPRAIVILMSGFPDREDAMARGVRFSAATYLNKPFEVEDLIHHVQQAVELRRATPPDGTVSH